MGANTRAMCQGEMCDIGSAVSGHATQKHASDIFPPKENAQQGFRKDIRWPLRGSVCHWPEPSEAESALVRSTAADREGEDHAADKTAAKARVLLIHVASSLVSSTTAMHEKLSVVMPRKHRKSKEIGLRMTIREGQYTRLHVMSVTTQPPWGEVCNGQHARSSDMPNTHAWEGPRSSSEVEQQLREDHPQAAVVQHNGLVPLRPCCVIRPPDGLYISRGGKGRVARQYRAYVPCTSPQRAHLSRCHGRQGAHIRVRIHTCLPWTNCLRYTAASSWASLLTLVLFLKESSSMRRIVSCRTRDTYDGNVVVSPVQGAPKDDTEKGRCLSLHGAGGAQYECLDPAVRALPA